jgi:hypothetical protein
MPEFLNTARAGDLDDVIISVASVRYSDGTPVVRVDVEQQAFDDKTYVDLSPEDAFWLARTVVAAVHDVAGNGTADEPAT